MIGVILTIIFSIVIGCSVTYQLWIGTKPSLVALLLIGIFVGLSIQSVVCYILLPLVGITVLTLYPTLLLISCALLFIQWKSGKLPSSIPTFNLDQKRILVEILAISVAFVALMLRLRSVLASDVLSAIDPWFWLYHTRYMLLTGGVDYSIAQAYPMGFVFFTSSLCLPTPGYAFVYNIIRFLGPVVSFGATYAVFKVMDDYFNDWRIGIVGSLGFAVGSLLQFRGRMATPETIALYFLIIFLSYLYIYKQNSPILTALMLTGLVLYHPTTALIAFGIWILTEISTKEWKKLFSELKHVSRTIILMIVMLLPALVTLSLNNDVIARYAFYGSSSNTPLSLWDTVVSMNNLVTYSLGGVIFGLSFLGVLFFLGGHRQSKWAFIGWLLCFGWAFFAFLPFLFFKEGAPRAATFIVFPAMILIGEVIQKIEKTLEGVNGSSLSFLKGVDARKGLVFVLIISAQLFYGVGYLYINERYITPVELNALEWTQSLDPAYSTVVVYDNWTIWNIATSVLYPRAVYSNDTLRSGNFSGFLQFIEGLDNQVLIFVNEHESCYTNLLLLGAEELYDNSGLHILLVTNP
jgi:hypothetical protein